MKMEAVSQLSSANGASVKVEPSGSTTCPFVLQLTGNIEEILRDNTKRVLSASNAYSIKLDSFPFCMLEATVYERAFPAKRVFHRLVERIQGLRVLISGHASFVRVRNLSPVPVAVRDNGKSLILSAVGNAVDLTHGCIITLFQFPPTDECSHFPPLQYRVINLGHMLQPRDAWSSRVISCQDCHWSPPPVVPQSPRYTLRLDGIISNGIPAALAPLESERIFSIPCVNDTAAIGRDLWTHAFGARFISFPTRHIPRCQFLLRPTATGVEVINCSSDLLEVDSRFVRMGEASPIHHGDTVSWTLTKAPHTLSLSYVLVDATAAAASTLESPRPIMNLSNVVDETKLEYFTPLIQRIEHLAQHEPMLQWMYKRKTLTRVRLSNVSTDAPVALLPCTASDNDTDFEFEIFWRHPCVFALRSTAIEAMEPNMVNAIVVQLLGIAASNEGSRTIAHHESASQACLDIARRLNIASLDLLDANYFDEEVATQLLGDCTISPP
ncbi:Aste57867_21687 [Aphanomyces stellatus]|uniref:Aste57867_21687 protein n=1 Tax=Aphanomyces stellatus TaxID=120398 RepID=A0A485LI66_9STRA|nr:hypothetical protein As57867_021618 [Aphanomyces stellatus]VFT98356.1 Aste57867_21687 [Aphanomyces stellatus]